MISREAIGWKKIVFHPIFFLELTTFKGHNWTNTTQQLRQLCKIAQELHTFGILVRNKWRNQPSPCTPIQRAPMRAMSTWGVELGTSWIPIEVSITHSITQGSFRSLWTFYPNFYGEVLECILKPLVLDIASPLYY